METLIQPSMDIDKMNIITDVFSQAITGEIVGMSNFAALAETVDDVHEKMEAVEHANSERMHAEGFLGLAAKYGLKTITNIEGVYWKNVRDRFLEYARKKDFIACLIIQEVMLESFAVSMYRDAGHAIGGDLAGAGVDGGAGGTGVFVIHAGKTIGVIEDREALGGG